MTRTLMLLFVLGTFAFPAGCAGTPQLGHDTAGNAVLRDVPVPAGFHALHLSDDSHVDGEGGSVGIVAVTYVGPPVEVQPFLMSIAATLSEHGWAEIGVDEGGLTASKTSARCELVVRADSARTQLTVLRLELEMP